MAQITPLSHRFPPTGNELIARILDDITPEVYREDYLLQRPLLRRGSAMDLTRLANDALLDDLLHASDCEIDVTQSGHILEHQRPYSSDEADQLSMHGCSCVFRHAERWSLDLAGYSTLMTQAIPGLPDLSIHQTPAGTHALDWRCDPDERFLVQAVGRMRYSLRANTVHPSPTACSMPPAGAWERESAPVLVFDLQPGDWLYIPGGWWHVGHAITDSRTLSLGLRVFAKIDLLRSIANDLARSAAWRGRMLEVNHQNPDAIDACQHLLRRFAETIRQTAEDPHAIASLLQAHQRPGSAMKLRKKDAPLLATAAAHR